jgi:uncharacterized membrane protein
VVSAFAYLVDCFENQPRWVWRVLAAGGCGLFLAIAFLVRCGAEASIFEAVVALVMLPLSFLAGGFLLATMDEVRRRTEAGHTVSRAARILFGMRAWSLLLWFTIVLILGFPIAALIGALTWK